MGTSNEPHVLNIDRDIDDNDVAHLDSEEVHGPPGAFLLPGLGTLPPLVDDGGDPVHSVTRHPEPRLAAGQGRLVPEKKEDNK